MRINDEYEVERTRRIRHMRWVIACAVLRDMRGFIALVVAFIAAMIAWNAFARPVCERASYNEGAGYAPRDAWSRAIRGEGLTIDEYLAKLSAPEARR